MPDGEIVLTVNGEDRRVPASPDRSLLSALRDDLGLTGAKFGCGEGRCAACTVLVDGEPVHACLSKLSGAAGKSIETIEGLADGDDLHPVQQAFLVAEALQCGFCTPGMIMGSVSLLRSNPDPTEAEIVDSMNGHLCRCGTYRRIVGAILDAARKMREAAR